MCGMNGYLEANKDDDDGDIEDRVSRVPVTKRRVTTLPYKCQHKQTTYTMPCRLYKLHRLTERYSRLAHYFAQFWGLELLLGHLTTSGAKFDVILARRPRFPI